MHVVKHSDGETQMQDVRLAMHWTVTLMHALVTCTTTQTAHASKGCQGEGCSKSSRGPLGFIAS